MKNFIWNGVYSSFEEAEKQGDPFQSKRYLDSTFNSTKELLIKLKEYNNISNIPFEITPIYNFSYYEF